MTILTTNSDGVYSSICKQNTPEKRIDNSVSQSKNTDKKLNSKTKALIGAGVFAGALLAYALIRRRNFTGLGAQIEGRNLNRNLSEASNHVMDNLGYKIQPPIVNPQTLADNSGFLDPKYNDIIENMLKDSNTQKRFVEVKGFLASAFEGIRNNVQETIGINIGSMDDPISSRLIAQKRYFSIPENHSAGYCCLDPLLYKEAREEAVDIFFGYNILEELNFESQSRLLNALRERYGSLINNQNNSFLDECVSRLAPEGAHCYGHESVFHAHELSRVGRIFREAMGIVVH